MKPTVTGRLTNHTGPAGAELFDPSRVGMMASDAIRGRRAQKAYPCPRLFNTNPFGVSKAAGIEANQTLRGTAFEAAPLIKPPALRGVSHYVFLHDTANLKYTQQAYGPPE